MVLALSHVSLNFATRCPDEGLHGVAVSVMQREFVDDVGKYVQAMGRLINGEKCGPNLEKLAVMGDSWDACLEAINLLPYSRLRDNARVFDLLTSGGTLAPARPPPLVASRIDLPLTLRAFDPCRF